MNTKLFEHRTVYDFSSLSKDPDPDPGTLLNYPAAPEQCKFVSISQQPWTDPLNILFSGTA
jgi:hypothetical protein